MPSLLDVLSGIGSALDTYSGAGSVRDLIAGENPFDQFIDPFNDEKRVSGRQMLEKRGWADENIDQGWIPDIGDLGGFAAEALLDPTNLLGGIGLAKRLMGISKAKAANRGIEAANALSREQRAMGFMPEEIAKLTKIVDESGAPKRMLHGTSHHDLNSFTDLDPSTGIQHTFSKGTYSTPIQDMANYHSGWHGNRQESWRSVPPPLESVTPSDHAKVLQGFVDLRNPYKIRTSAIKDPEAAFFRNLPESIRERIASVEPVDSWRGHSGLAARRRQSKQLKATELLQELGHDGVTVYGPNGLEEVVTYSKDQHYLPYLAKELQDLQRVASPNSLLASLAGYNALAHSDLETDD